MGKTCLVNFLFRMVSNKEMLYRPSFSAFLSSQQNARENYNLIIVNKSFENATEFKFRIIRKDT
jgi:hypothetical protein